MTPPVQGNTTLKDRRLRIELLRLEAGYQRLAVRRSACRLAGAVQPEALAARAGDHLRAVGLGWLGMGLGILQRYPMMGSLLGSVLGSGGRRGLALKAVLLAGLIWLKRRDSADRKGAS